MTEPTELTPLTLTYQDAAALVSAASAAVPAHAAEALAYVVDGDVWQAGRVWVGPRPTGNLPGDGLVSLEIERGLAAANLARELVDRRVAGLLGREPDWDLGIPDADDEALTQWWDQRGILAVLREVARRAECGEPQTLRMLIPGGTPATRPATLEAALSLIAVERLGPTTATVIDDAAAGLHLGVAVFDAAPRTLAGRLGRAAPQRTAEITATTATGETALILHRDDGVPVEPALLPLGGRLTMHGVTPADPLLTPSLLSLQRHLTLALSSMGRNTQTAGFVERVMKNAERPMDANGNPLPYQAGAGMTNWLFGVLQPDNTYATPDLDRIAPSSPEAFTATAAEIVFHAHKEARQLHALLSGDAAPSGESRRQAAADFLASLGPSAREIERAVRWLLETSYALAQHLMGRGVSPDLRATVTMTLSAGVATIEEIAEAREGVGAKLLRRSRYQTAMGVDDPVAEEDAISEERQDEPDPPVVVQAQPQPTPDTEVPAQ